MTRFCICTGSSASALELSRKRNKLTREFCKSCGGTPLVDGIGPVSASMLSTATLELTNFINPNLSWKTVTKGYRSTTRRCRKIFARSFNAGAEQDEKSSKRLQDSVSESEKLGVAVLGRRFADKLVDVPIKKRRLMLQSPSPPPRTPSRHREDSLSPQPQTPSSHSGEFEQLVDLKCASGQWSCPDSSSNQQTRAFDGAMAVKFADGIEDGVLDGKISEVTIGNFGCSEDFSGIALLAAAACYNSFGDDDNAMEDPVIEEFSTPEGFDSSTSIEPLKDTITSSRPCNLFEKGVAREHNMDDSLVQENPFAGSQSVNAKECCGAVKSSVPSKDDRLHWDLNTVMDAWEQPFGDPPVHIQRNDPEAVLNEGMPGKKLENLESGELNIVMDAAEQHLDNQSVCFQRNISEAVPDEDIECKRPKNFEGCETRKNSEDLRPHKSNIEEHKLDACSGPEKTCIGEKCVSAPNECTLETLDYVAADIKASSQVVSIDASLDYPPCSGSHHSSRACDFEENINTVSASIAVTQNGEDCGKTSSMQPDGSVTEKVLCESSSTQSKDVEDSRRTSVLPDNRTSLQEMISTVTCNTLVVEKSANDSDKVDLSPPSHKCDNFFASGSSVGEGQPVVVGYANEQDGNACVSYTVETNSPGQPKELKPKHHGDPVFDGGARDGLVLQESCTNYSGNPISHSSKVVLPFDDCFNSDVSQDDRALEVAVENMSELQAGYDSPFEDGELRDSGAYSWDENEVEDGETECVDYGSDNREDDYGVDDYSMSEKVGDEFGCGGPDLIERGNSSATEVMDVEFSKSRLVKTQNMQLTRKDGDEKPEMVGNRGLNAGSGNTRKSCASDQTDGLDIRRSLGGEVGSRASGGKLLSRIEGPSSLDVLDRKDTAWSRSHNLGESYSRGVGFGKYMARDISSLHVRDRTGRNGHWVDSSVGYWDSRNRYPSTYRGLDGHGYGRPRSVITNSDAKVGGMNSHDHRQSINYSSKGLYRLPIRRRLPIDRNDCYGVHKGMPPVGGISRDRSKDRSRLYPRGISRGAREEYYEAVTNDTTASSVRMPHYVARRDRSLSPAFSRGAHFSEPHRRSCSRSRTRSPPAWKLQRERHADPRRHSRSPNFRSEVRTERTRLSFKKPSFAADYEEGLKSPVRGRLSPQRNSRFVDERNCMDGPLGDRRSPVRMFRRSQRFESVGSSGRLKSDGYFRDMIRPVRFSLMAGGSRGHKYEDSDDERRKHDNRYEMIRVRCYDTCGVVRRFRYDVEECFEGRNSHNEDDCIRESDRSDAPRSGREDRGGPFRYNNDRMYIGLQHYDEDASPRRG